MSDAPILICYDHSDEARHAIETAAPLLGARRAVVLDVGQPLTSAESFAALDSVVPGTAFEDLNQDGALEVARAGADLAGRAGFSAEPRGGVASRKWEGILDVADEIDADVIVIGSRGLSAGRELFERSLSHEVAEHARRPVLIVPPQA